MLRLENLCNKLSKFLQTVALTDILVFLALSVRKDREISHEVDEEG